MWTNSHCAAWGESRPFAVVFSQVFFPAPRQHSFAELFLSGPRSVQQRLGARLRKRPKRGSLTWEKLGTIIFALLSRWNDFRGRIVSRFLGDSSTSVEAI
jgi:hypothetical protein